MTILFSALYITQPTRITHATLLIANEIQKAIENKMYSCGIFLDWIKAFDTVNHTILLEKLENSGIRAITQKLFSSYLSNNMCRLEV